MARRARKQVDRANDGDAPSAVARAREARHPFDALPRTRGFAVLRGRVPRQAVQAALRCLHLDILRRGLSTEEIRNWHSAKCWFPHLRWEREILDLLTHVPPPIRRGTLCEPQILLQLPDEAAEWPLAPHVDQPPPWANGQHYRKIIGVALSASDRRNGGLMVWPRGSATPTAVELSAGDVVVMAPSLPHSGGLNREGGIRYVVYFRFLDSADRAT